MAAVAHALFVVGLVVALRSDPGERALRACGWSCRRCGSVAGVAYVIALFGWSYATVELLADKAGMRLCGYGLVLLALGGYDAGSPVELTLSLLGLVAVSVGELRAAPYADRRSTARHRRRVARLRRPPGDGARRRHRARTGRRPRR